MKLGHSHDEIKYDTTIGPIARYVVSLDGQPTMHILCNMDDPEKVILIARVGDVGEQKTAGRFTTVTELIEDSEGMPAGVGAERVDEKSVYTYVVPRLTVLLGRLLRAA